MGRDGMSIDDFQPKGPQAIVEPPPLGTVCLFAGDDLPEGWAWCDGEEMARQSTAFRLLGTKFGEGDGSKTFNLPRLRDPERGIRYMIKLAHRQPAEGE